MYNFIDVTEVSEGYLPSEALRMNEEYIENLIPGYRTLYVSGREALAPELNLYETGSRDGSRLGSRRYPARIITVGYQLITDSPEKFRMAYNNLASILNVVDAELIFADEQDKFFIGTPSGLGEIEPGRNSVTGEIEFTCMDPFKYSVNEYEVEPTLDNGTFLIDYKGTYKSFPTLEADFYDDESVEENDNGRCGYVAFFDDNEKVLQFGNPEELSEEEIEIVNTETNTYLVPTTKVLLNHSFVKTNGWSSAKSKYAINGGVIYKGPVKTGSIGAKHSYATSAANTYYLTATGFGSGSSYHGPTATYTFSEPAADFQFNYSQKMCVGSAKADKKQRGAFQMILSDASGVIVAGVYIFKGADGTKATCWIIVNGKVVNKISNFDLSYHNKYFGANRSANKKKNISAITTVKSSSITKTGSNIRFNIGGISRNFTVNEIKLKEVKKVTVLFSGKGKSPALEYNGLYWMKMVKNYKKTVTETIETITTEWHDVQNKFNANDVLTIDCPSGSVKLNDLERADLGALGNDWEAFYLQPGVNQIGTSYSDWVDDMYAPTFKMRYREVFL